LFVVEVRLVAAIVIGALLFAVFVYFVVIWVLGTYRRQVSAGREELIGKTAVVKTALKPKGVVLIEGEHWTATLDKGWAEPEEEVIITRVEGLTLVVTRK
jgi:membrane-bound serine protease (ClpP class)